MRGHAETSSRLVKLLRDRRDRNAQGDGPTTAVAGPDEIRGKIWLQRAITLWIVLLAAASVKAIVQPNHHTVYHIFSASARHWWQDMPLQADYNDQGIPLYRYSPTFAIAMTPLAVFPDWLGGILWNVISVTLFVWSLRMLARELLPGSWPPWREGLFLALALFGSLRGIWSGQSNSLVFALIVFAMVAITRRRWWTASCLLALPVFIKIWPLAVVLLLMACWPRQLIWRFLVPTTLLAAVPFLTRPLHVVAWQYQGWYQSLTGVQHDRCPGFRDAWTIWENVWPPVNWHAYAALQLATALAVLAWCLWQKRRSDSTGQLLTAILAIWIAWQLLLGPGTERLTYQLIAPMASWALLVSYARKRGRVLSTAAWLMTGMFSMGAFERALLPYLPWAEVLLPLGIVAFIVWLMANRWKQAPVKQPTALDREAVLAIVEEGPACKQISFS